LVGVKPSNGETKRPVLAGTSLETEPAETKAAPVIA
jgi:hypothetical protein